MHRLTFETNIGLSIDKGVDCPSCSICWACDVKVNECPYFEDVIKKLKQYEDMEEQGKLVILPCNVNDRIHTFYNSDIEWCFEVGMNIEEIMEDMCEERRVTGFDVRDDGLWIILNGGIFNPDDRIPAEEFGKTVFMTEQEAHETLEIMKGE